ncbi:DUF3899 domain-containing protein [Heyndrickxia sp. NPDC080065]|uniref:DUF3899 domain-containing protein n=1 Tax=Heyndrickxia sp. NPDC080065 TaxID=3390568 RepID=UPI003CFC5EFB
MFKKYTIWFIASQIFVFLLSFIVYHSIDLLSYINVSFVVGFLLLLLSLTGYIINRGFFDIVFSSFQNIFSRMTDSDRRKLSELIPLKYHLPFFTAIFMLLVMFCALLGYYF